MHALWPGVWLGVFLACACSQPAAHPPAATADALTIPVSEASGARLAQLGERAETDPEAAWVRLHYLLDLFDDARFRGDDDSLRLLSRALGEEVTDPPLRGPLQTDRLIDRLRAEADRVGQRPGAPAEVADGRALLVLDADWPRRRAEAPGKLAPIVSLASARSPLAANAALRLVGYCVTAVRDAVRAAPERRPAILAHCLYALGQPEAALPYFAGPARRPPLQPIVTGLHRLLATASADPRLAAAAARQRALLDSLLDRHRSALDDQGENLDRRTGGP